MKKCYFHSIKLPFDAKVAWKNLKCYLVCMYALNCEKRAWFHGSFNHKTAWALLTVRPVYYKRTCIFPMSPVDSIRLATLTVFPQMSYWGFWAPTTPATTQPYIGNNWFKRFKHHKSIAKNRYWNWKNNCYRMETILPYWVQHEVETAENCPDWCFPKAS